MKKLVYVIGSIVFAISLPWMIGIFDRLMPSPAQTLLATENVLNSLPILKSEPTPQPKERFRIVLCWLQRDYTGNNGEIVAEAFTVVDGVELMRSARTVKATGAKQDWQLAMREGALMAMDIWSADLAIVGRVDINEPSKMSLWFVPKKGNDTFDNAYRDNVYHLSNWEHGNPKFLGYLHVQIASLALASVPPSKDGRIEQVVKKSLSKIIEKIESLLKDNAKNTVPDESQAALYYVHGVAHHALSKREGDTTYLNEAIESYNNALEIYTCTKHPLIWAGTQNNLGNAFLDLNQRERNIGYLRSALTAYDEALKVYDRENMPLIWAGTQNNRGNALFEWSLQNCNTELLGSALAIYEEALEVRTRDKVPLDWAMTQNNLGNALVALGKCENKIAFFNKAIESYNNALKIYTHTKYPLGHAMTQNNIGNVLLELGRRKDNTKLLEEARDVYRAALDVYGKEYPLDRSDTQNNLGNVLWELGRRANNTKLLEEAIVAYQAALDVFHSKDVNHLFRLTLKNCNNAKKYLWKIAPSPEKEKFWAESCSYPRKK